MDNSNAAPVFYQRDETPGHPAQQARCISPTAAQNSLLREGEAFGPIAGQFRVPAASPLQDERIMSNRVERLDVPCQSAVDRGMDTA
jgi:hypothetical protein